jgi:hypothetical protein
MSNNDGADFARTMAMGEEIARLMVEAEALRKENEWLREMLIEARDDATRFGRLMQKCVIALREIAEGDRPDNDEQFCVGYWGATARAALEEKSDG